MKKTRNVVSKHVVGSAEAKFNLAMFEPYDRSGLLDPEAQVYMPDDAKFTVKLRNNFVRKVFSILAAQLLLTAALGCLFTLSASWQQWALNNTWLGIAAGIAAIAVMLVITCIPGMSQKVPMNYALLGTFTVLEALSLGPLLAAVSVRIGAYVVVEAVVLTALVVVALTFVAFQTKYDFTSWVSYVAVATMVMLGFGLLRMLFPASRFVDNLYAMMGAGLCGVYLIMDMQMMLGKGRVQVSTDDYISAAMNLYVDVVMMFVYMLQLLTNSQRDD